jgi:transcription-repair coupling factor (superfamily II helicase)
MITLFLKTISEQIRKYKPYKKIIEEISKGNFPVHLSGPERSSLALVTANVHRAVGGTLFIVFPTEKEAEEFAGDLDLFSDDIYHFPWLDVIPYQGARIHASILGARMHCLAGLISGREGIYVTSVRNLIYPLPPKEFIESSLIRISAGDEFDPEGIGGSLADYGYLRVPKVTVPGEFALRGEVLDVYLTGEERPFRIVFEFDTVEHIRTFDPDTQFTEEDLKSVTLYPAREILWSKVPDDVETGDGRTSAAVRDKYIEEGEGAHEEIHYPLVFDERASLFDYAGKRTFLWLPDAERLDFSAQVLAKEYSDIYDTSEFRGIETLSPNNIFLDYPEVAGGIEKRVVQQVIGNPEIEKRTIRMPIDGPRSFFGNIRYLKEELDNLIGLDYSLWVFSESETQAERLKHLLKDHPVEVVTGRLSSGFSIPDLKIAVIQENEIFGRRRRIPKSVKQAKSRAIDTFVELNPGDYVVHINYGIGQFLGIERIKAAGTERDYIQVRYADEETLFIPIEQVNLIQKYIGSEGASPRLDRIGGKTWENRKGKVKKSVEELAGTLIKLYSRRKAAAGYAFPPDTDWQMEFEAAFPYEETEDQLTCIREVKEDMESPRPMDRLICGDVGYGKTEVAMRAAFKAVTGGRQVVFLAPTTILAEQHFENFSERFEHFPVQIAMLSRFVSKAEQKKIVGRTEKGEIDILIGTHRVLQKDVRFKNLGLIVIDEEQRFGVKDKERLKQLKTSIDCMTMTATPIPRTLHMSLLKIRDMSLLRTPPRNRLPIETYIQEFNEDSVADAIRRELTRGGQVFYLHNRVETLDNVRIFLQKLVPEAMIDAAHGQMGSSQLEEIMHRFVHGGSQVLVSTTIIENGIDIPNVNTIIIDRADMYGLSQLYQLRGRVGRADRPAYAYLLYPSDRVLNEVAMKRLKILSEYTELGSGFKIAMKDLEVRGAGNLLGRQQHGDILAVGFDMYIRLLDEALAELSPEEIEKEREVYLELDYSGYIPESYISEPEEKMEVYKRIASIQEEEELGGVMTEVEDRFGPMPVEVQSLLSLAEIRVLCRKLYIESLKERRGTLEVAFARVSEINVDKILRLIHEGGDFLKLDPKRPNVLLIKTELIGLKEKSEFIREKLSALV